jgi:hypothetical protein
MFTQLLISALLVTQTPAPAQVEPGSTQTCLAAIVRAHPEQHAFTVAQLQNCPHPPGGVVLAGSHPRLAWLRETSPRLAVGAYWCVPMDYGVFDWGIDESMASWGCWNGGASWVSYPRWSCWAYIPGANCRYQIAGTYHEWWWAATSWVNFYNVYDWFFYDCVGLRLIMLGNGGHWGYNVGC